MGQKRRILIFTALLFIVGASWLWWVKPGTSDMATYAPANSLLYLEANRPLEVVAAITGTDAWQLAGQIPGASAIAPRRDFLQSFIRWTGIGPIQSVILARSQVAVVVTDLGAAEEGEALRIKQEEAILIETHTSEGRIREPFEQAIKTLAEKFYGRPTLRRTTLDGVEFLEWGAPDGARRIIAVIVGSLVIVGNTERAVQDCLAVNQGKRSSLQGDPELARMRLQLGGAGALTFGYVPAANSPRLLALGLPILLGRAPGDSEFQRLITTGAARIFGSLAWTSRPYRAGIEDQYLITLQPAIVARLKPNFVRGAFDSQVQRLTPTEAYSVTSYRFANASAAWQSLKGAVASEADALSSIVFSTLLKSALLSYGVEDPDAFLGTVSGELLSLRLDENAERSVLVAGIRDRALLRELISKSMGPNLKTNRIDQTELLEDAQGEFAAGFVDELIVMGEAASVRRYVNSQQQSSHLSSERFKQMVFFASANGPATVVTYTNDATRVRNFITAAVAARGGSMASFPTLDEAIAGLPYAVTETTLGERGIERVTRSPLGQFSTLLPLLAPEQSTSFRNNAPPK